MGRPVRTSYFNLLAKLLPRLLRCVLCGYAFWEHIAWSKQAHFEESKASDDSKQAQVNLSPCDFCPQATPCNQELFMQMQSDHIVEEAKTSQADRERKC